LQRCFAATRAALRERGTIVPEVWDHAPGNPSHTKLTQHLRDGKTHLLQPHFAELLASRAPRVLLTSEDLSNLDNGAVARLKALTAGNPVRIVFYMRRWSELVFSSWQEGVKQGQHFTLPEFALIHLQRPHDSRLMNYRLKLTPFIEVFGKNALSLVSYSELRDREIDIFQHFAASFLDWKDAPTVVDAVNANASREPDEVELLRALNAMCHARGEAASGRMRRELDQSRARTDIATLRETMQRYMSVLRFNDNWPLLASVQESLAEEFEQQMVKPLHQGKMFRPRSKDLSYVSPDYMVAPGAAEMLRALFAVFDRTVAKA